MRKFLVLVVFSLFTVSGAKASPVTGELAPEFSAVTSQGEELSFPREQDGVDLYFFWASWCPYCKAFMPHLQSIEEEYGDQVRIFALQIRDEEDGAAYLDRLGFTFDLVPNADDVMAPYAVKGTPGLFIVDGSGIIRMNLTELQGQELSDDLKRTQRAARRGPWWASEIRKKLDVVLAGQNAN